MSPRFALLFFLALATVAAQDVADEDEGDLEAADVTQDCLRCICEGVSKCDETKKCTHGGSRCGPLRITWPFWADAGKPVPDGVEEDSEQAFKECAFNFECASTAVKGYMNKYAQDCNNDKKIDCSDYANIFRLGGNGCVGQLDNLFGNRFNECKKEKNL